MDLSDVDTSDLKIELKKRGHWYDAWEGLDALKAAGCPAELLEPVREWLYTPTVNSRNMED